MKEILEIQQYAEKIASGGAKIHPGQPFTFSPAMQAGDGVWQGDLGIELVDEIPKGYKKLETEKRDSLQLVPGNTQGSRHVLLNPQQCEVYFPEKWNADDYEDLEGPCIKALADAEISHPTHGSVTVLGGQTVRCRYQREFDLEQKRERRNAD